MSNKQESPEFNAQYIDQLLSGPSVGKAPEPPAEAPAPEPPKTRPTATRHPRRWILILTAFLVAVVSLCLLLPDLLANAQSDRWQARCKEAYAELMSKQRPFLIEVQRYHESEKTSEESTVTHWQYGKDYLTVETSKEKTTHQLAIGNRVFVKTDTPDNPDGIWKTFDIFIGTGSDAPKTFSNLDHALPSIRATLLRVDVTFSQVNASGIAQTICFHFDPFGKLLGINTTIAGDSVSRQQNLTVLSTNPEKIKSAIQKAYEEATGKK